MEACPHSTLVKEGEELARQGRETVEWLRILGVSKPADRYHGYLRAIESFAKLQGDNSAIIKVFDTFNQIADIFAQIDGRKIYIEAKRIKSSGKLASRVSEANNQLKKRLVQDSSSKSRGGCSY